MFQHKTTCFIYITVSFKDQLLFIERKSLRSKCGDTCAKSSNVWINIAFLLKYLLTLSLGM